LVASIDPDERAPLISRNDSHPSDAQTEAARFLEPPGQALFRHLPRALFYLIAGFASDADIIAMSKVNTTWKAALNAPRRSKVPVRILHRATPAFAGALRQVTALVNQFTASLDDLPMQSRAHLARVMQRPTRISLLESQKARLLTERAQCDRKANAVQRGITPVLGAGFYIHATGLVGNGLAWAESTPHSLASWTYLASIFPAGLVAAFSGTEAPGDSAQSARSHLHLMAYGVASAAFRAVTTVAFTMAAADLAAEGAHGEPPSASRYVPAVIMVGSALTDAALCGWAAWHRHKAIQGKEKVVQIEHEISNARASPAALSGVVEGLKMSVTGFHGRIDILVEEAVPGALAALAARTAREPTRPAATRHPHMH